jgi:hypothetical protein
MVHGTAHLILRAYRRRQRKSYVREFLVAVLFPKNQEKYCCRHLKSTPSSPCCQLEREQTNGLNSPLLPPHINHYAQQQSQHRLLSGKDVAYDPLLDECLIGMDSDGYEIFGTCDPLIHFPVCGTNEFICTNRINRQDKFYPDKNPYYYIDPKRVLCYPNEWLTLTKLGGCSTCSPGRYCASERRCILEEQDYPCEGWL